ncbi:hypothetical protein [Bradyrhizobium sp. ARR65]|uniref:hypothetical protein n=1 Tax=Bradyrhizobium sp. ARR65 TaxID=1040989 RepID=UPI000684F0DF|nr:hypothetical protein [Bradyrhizobium sp. ARR65]
MAERAMDAATDVSRSIGEATAGLKAAVERLRVTLSDAQSGRVIPALRQATREAPLTSLFAAFLLGAMLARRH